MNQQSLETLVAQALEQAKQQGASQAEAAANQDNGLSVTVRLNEVETLEYQRDRGLGITVYFGQRKGSASTADFSAAAIAQAVEKACSIARYTAEDDCAGLADAGLMAQTLPDLALDHPWPLTPEEAIDIARRCEATARAYDPRIDNSEGATVTSHRGVRVYGNSHGFIGGYPASGHSISCSVVARQDQQMQRDYWYSADCDPAALLAPEAIGEIAGQRTVARLGSRRISTRKTPVLFAPEMAKSLLGHFLSAISGRAQYRESTFLLGAEGDTIFPDFIQIKEQPHLKRAAGSAPFDAEGVATQMRHWVQDGRLQGYILGSYSARKLGRQTTGNAGGVHNLELQIGPSSQQALLAQMDTGLLVTELMGQGVNGVTGDYSRGAAGFWVENGELAYPVEEITIAGNLRDIYRNIVAVGNDLDTRGNIRTGSILLEEMTVAGE
ncbi:MAG TPA: metalloprotease PmbA [Gammaproteobacteria bacterium]|nr:metalloprotease PmbA [Gammaproteobacteria bacterium]